MRSTHRWIVVTRRDLPSITFFLLLTCSLALAMPLTARAAPTDDAVELDEYDVKARVARVSLIAGEVNLKRAGNSDWERIRLNYPLVEGDTISTSNESRAEIQIDARNFVRLGANSILRIVTLRDEGVALSVVEGTATIRLAKFDRDHEYFELDAPKTTMAAEKKGLYRVDVSPAGRVRLTARDGGRARIYSETSGFALREGRSAELILEGANAGDWEFVAAGSDSWDSWVDDRERYLAERLRYDVQYYDKYTWGAEDLDSYGNWTYANEYGWIWRPHASSINIYHDWAPYRYGSWVWVSP
jgi:FecR protein